MVPASEWEYGLSEDAERDSLPMCRWHMVRLHRRPAGDAQQPTGLLDLDGSGTFRQKQKTRYPFGHLVFWYAERDSNPRPTDS